MSVELCLLLLTVKLHSTCPSRRRREQSPRLLPFLITTVIINMPTTGRRYPESIYNKIIKEMVGMQISPNQVRFIQSIAFLSNEYRRAFYHLFEDKLNYGMVPFLRMMVDNIVTVQGYMLYEDKDKYCNYFLDDKPLNQLKIGEKSISHTTIFNITGDIELSELYKHYCRYLHPTTAAFDKVRPPYCGFENRIYGSRDDEREAIRGRFRDVDFALQNLLREAIHGKTEPITE